MIVKTLLWSLAESTTADNGFFAAEFRVSVPAAADVALRRGHGLVAEQFRHRVDADISAWSGAAQPMDQRTGNGLGVLPGASEGSPRHC